MNKKKNVYVGLKVGKLSVTKCLGSHNNQIHWECTCECGKRVVHTTKELNWGNIHSCGCGLLEMYKNNKKIDDKDKTLYIRWQMIKDRCNNPNSQSYKDYGGRGITICPEWSDDFFSFRNWSYENGFNKSLSLDRIDNNKGYSPDNCRWTTSKVQGNNRRTNHYVTIEGVTKTLMEWSEEYGIKYDTIQRRIRDGWSEIDAITKPIIPLNERNKKSLKRT